MTVHVTLAAVVGTCVLAAALLTGLLQEELVGQHVVPQAIAGLHEESWVERTGSTRTCVSIPSHISVLLISCGLHLRRGYAERQEHLAGHEKDVWCQAAGSLGPVIMRLYGCYQDASAC